jgi:5'-3' exonuclease
MGIPWYFYTIYKKYNYENDLMINENAISEIDIEYLFLDYNSMIHPCAQRVLALTDETNESKLEESIIKSCLDYTRYIINVIKPRVTYIMIDGVAPRAKINQQRERRYKSHFFKEFSGSVKWNSNKITPGTKFMDNLIKELNIFKKEIHDIIISDSNEPGEGEHKMMSTINNLSIEKDDKICIYGLDADLLMLSLLNIYSSNIILLRDNTFNTKLSESDKIYTYVNIKKLRQYICQELRQDNNFENISDDNLIRDYIFLCFLLGNDFLEHIPSLLIKENGLAILIKSYNTIIQKYKTKGTGSLINKNSLYNKNWQTCINLHMLRDIFYELSKVEDYFYSNIYSAYKKETNYRDIYDLDQINTDCKNVFFYKTDIIKYNKSGYKNRYYQFYNVYDKESAITEYITGLYWILGYYNGHIHDNWSWFYSHHATPFASDIFTFLSNDKNINIIYERNLKILQPTIPNTTLEQLFMVLPKDSLIEILQSINIEVYEKTIRIFNTHSKNLQDYYPTKIYLELIHKEYLWQSKIFLKTFYNKIIDIFI